MGARITELRQNLGLNLDGLAARMERDSSWVGRIERGNININARTIQRFATALEVSPAALFEAPSRTRSVKRGRPRKRARTVGA